MTKLSRIITHWAAASYMDTAASLDKYHFLVLHDGTIVAGTHVPEDNEYIGDGHYAAHTKNCNTGSIGVTMVAMGRAKQFPFFAGPWPITDVQLDSFYDLVASLCIKYGIPVTRETVLSHAEVQPTLKIKQDQKWDISWLPGMSASGDAVKVGDLMRAEISKRVEEKGGRPTFNAMNYPTLQKGSYGNSVSILQQLLRENGALALIVDGDFGDITKEAVMIYQVYNGLKADGIVGAKTWAMLTKESKE